MTPDLPPDRYRGDTGRTGHFLPTTEFDVYTFKDYFPPQYTTAERVHLLLGEVPYSAIVFGPADADEALAPSVEVAILEESLPGESTGSTATSGYAAGSRFPCVWTGDRHTTDARRLMRPCAESTGDPID